MKVKKLNIDCLAILAVAIIAVFVSSCDKSESYTDLLRDEQRAVNAFLAQQQVEVDVPEDSIFIVGENAPFYRMNEDGTIYMQVINPGDSKDKPESGDRVYFRYRRKNLKSLYETGSASWQGNMDNFNSNVVNNVEYVDYSTSFVLGNKIYPTTTQFGTGIQLPMTYLGFYSEVNLVLKSYAGFPNDQTACTPFLVNVKYYKPEF